jgi:amidase
MVIVSAESLQEAAETAVEEMAAIVSDRSELTYEDSRKLLSLIADLRFGQIVNPLKTVRIALPLTAVPWTRHLVL